MGETPWGRCVSRDGNGRWGRDSRCVSGVACGSAGSRHSRYGGIRLAHAALLGVGCLCRFSLAPHHEPRFLAANTLDSLSLVLVSTFAATAIGVPLGIACAHRPALAAGLRPVLDLMQTLPTFVYL